MKKIIASIFLLLFSVSSFAGVLTIQKYNPLFGYSHPLTFNHVKDYGWDYNEMLWIIYENGWENPTLISKHDSWGSSWIIHFSKTNLPDTLQK